MLEPRVQAEFDEIRAIMRGQTAEAAEADRQAKQRMDDHEKRMAEIDAAHRKRMDEMDAAHRQRMAEIDAKHEKRMAAIEKRSTKIEKRSTKIEKRSTKIEKDAAERDQRWERRFAANEVAWRQRADKFDRQLLVTKKLVEAGMKLVRGLAADTRELKKSQKAFLDSFKNGRNGHGHRN